MYSMNTPGQLTTFTHFKEMNANSDNMEYLLASTEYSLGWGTVAKFLTKRDEWMAAEKQTSLGLSEHV